MLGRCGSVRASRRARCNGRRMISRRCITPNLQASQALVVRTFAVIRSARGLDHAMQDAERGQRGFLITGDDAYLDPYRAGLKEAPERLRELQQLTSDNPAQQWRIGELDDQIGRKLAAQRQ